MKRHLGLLICAFLSMLLWSCGGPKEEASLWKGSMTEKNGVIVVRNPKEPVYTGDFLTFEEELSIGEAGEGAEEYMFHNQPAITVDEAGNIYTVDSRQDSVRVYDSNGKYLLTVGSKGQGPGEFVSPGKVWANSDGEIIIFDIMGQKLLFYSSNGRYLRQTVLPCSVSNIFMDSGDSLFGLGWGKGEQTERDNQLVRCDPPYGEFSIITSRPHIRKFFLNMPFQFAAAGPDQIFWREAEDYVLYVYDTRERRIIKKIIKDFTPKPITRKFMENWGPMMKGGLKIDPKRKSLPPIQALYPSLDGFIFVRTFETNEDNHSIYNVFDPEWRYLGDLTLPGNPYLTKGDKLYTVGIDPDGYCFVKRYRIVRHY